MLPRRPDLGRRAVGEPERDPLGVRGDFTTAPEVSQMFGEMIGLWCVDLWTRMGKPAPFILAELGPGRGTLMADALRAARVAPDFLAAAQLHLVEINATLIAAQKAALQGFAPQWHRSFDSLPPGPVLLPPPGPVLLPPPGPVLFRPPPGLGLVEPLGAGAVPHGP